jgi:glucose dehydrogenase
MVAERPGPVLLTAAIVGSLASGQALDRVLPPTSAVSTEDGQWSRPARDYANTRYSALDEITAENVGQLRVGFSFSTGVNRGQEAAALVVGNTMC